MRKVLVKRERKKHCKGCAQDLPISAFGKDKNAPDGFTYKCKSCRNIVNRKHYEDRGGYRSHNEKHKEARRLYYAKPENKRRCESDRLKREFGITIEQYEEMHTRQGGVCAICRKPETSSRAKKLAVDHCHDTGKVRGLLCQRCNRGIGLLEDNESLLVEAVQYLNRFRGTEHV